MNENDIKSPATPATQSQVFAIDRFAVELRRMFFSQGKRIILQIVVIASIIILGALYIQYVTMKTIDENYFKYGLIEQTMRESLPQAQTTFFAVMFMLMGCVSASLMFPGLATKEGRTSLLVVPTSTLEKFVTQWSVYVLGFILVFAVSMVVADLLRTAIFTLFAPKEIPVYTSIWFVRDNYHELLRGLRIYVALYLFLSSLFMVGSVVWPHNSFLKSIALIIVIAIALTVWTVVWVDSFNSRPFRIEHYLRCDKAWLTFGVLTLLAIFNWWITYRRFKETDVVAHL